MKLSQQFIRMRTACKLHEAARHRWSHRWPQHGQEDATLPSDASCVRQRARMQFVFFVNLMHCMMRM